MLFLIVKLLEQKILNPFGKCGNSRGQGLFDPNAAGGGGMARQPPGGEDILVLLLLLLLPIHHHPHSTREQTEGAPREFFVQN